jgi:hypothetical protein
LGSSAFHAPEGAFSAKYGRQVIDPPLEFGEQLGGVASAFDGFPHNRVHLHNIFTVDRLAVSSKRRMRRIVSNQPGST